eukprot:COSAG05_NODE_7839_length_764_cov_1.219549_1_plen_30_part_10
MVLLTRTPHYIWGVGKQCPKARKPARELRN